MIAVLGTLPFIATLWLLMVLGAAVLEENGGKIAAALKGKSVGQPSAPTSLRVRMRRNSAPKRGQPSWRAAA